MAQKKTANQIIEKILQRTKGDVLTTLSQSGKTMSLSYIIKKLIREGHFDMDHILILTCQRTKEQFSKRFPECFFLFFRNNIFHNTPQDVNKLKSRITENRDILVILDEVHIGELADCFTPSEMERRNVNLLKVSATPDGVLFST